jgi:signal transduction histidine kinase
MENAELGDLLHQLVDGVKGRTTLAVSTQIQGQCEAPARVKENLFRIAQEGLNNVVKHARARHVNLTLKQSKNQVTLSISDDGQGFDENAIDGGHLGLQIMRERAHNIGAELTITSLPGQGTVIVAIWPGAGS